MVYSLCLLPKVLILVGLRCCLSVVVLLLIVTELPANSKQELPTGHAAHRSLVLAVDLPACNTVAINLQMSAILSLAISFPPTPDLLFTFAFVS